MNENRKGRDKAPTGLDAATRRTYADAIRSTPDLGHDVRRLLWELDATMGTLDEHGRPHCWVSLKRIAIRWHLTLRAVQKTVRKAEASGWLDTEQRLGKPATYRRGPAWEWTRDALEQLADQHGKKARAMPCPSYAEHVAQGVTPELTVHPHVGVTPELPVHPHVGVTPELPVHPHVGVTPELPVHPQGRTPSSSPYNPTGNTTEEEQHNGPASPISDNGVGEAPARAAPADPDLSVAPSPPVAPEEALLSSKGVQVVAYENGLPVITGIPNGIVMWPRVTEGVTTVHIAGKGDEDATKIPVIIRPDPTDRPENY